MCSCPNTVNSVDDACGECQKDFSSWTDSVSELAERHCTDLPAAPPVITGVKHDQGKPDYSYISKELMDEVARVREFGAIKYSRDNWKNGFRYQRSIAAALRHIFAFKDGEDLDPESGLSHIGHALCCLEHLLYDFKHHKQNDDRGST